MKTCLFLLAAAVPCLAFQQASPVSSVRQRRLDAAFVVMRAAAAVEEPPAIKQDTSELPPVLQIIVDERAEFQMNLGKAMDTLRKDYPDILHKSPGTNLANLSLVRIHAHLTPALRIDFSIYHDDIRVMDPSGVQLSGLRKYKNAFLVMQTLMKIFYHQKSRLQYRMVYDFCRSTIRVSWHLQLHPKIGMGGVAHVDGISAYTLDAASGKIVQHRIENILINNSPVKPPYGMFTLVQEESPQGIAVGGMCIEETAFVQ